MSIRGITLGLMILVVPRGTIGLMTLIALKDLLFELSQGDAVDIICKQAVMSSRGGLEDGGDHSS